MPSRISGRRRAGLAGFAGLVLTVGLALTGCDPSAADGGATASATPSAAVTTAPPAPVAPPTTPAAPAATPTTLPVAPAVTPPAQPVAPSPAAATPSKAPQAPQPKVTTAQPPADPEPQHTAAAAGGGCELRSAAGNCYEAGQFCRNADLGKSTHDASGRVITCRVVSGKPHWQA
ncbi:hypothetical protein ACIRD3_05920 [Kitasatospora sp. NPDC093550]|uniref:hypothetical protein n=1 Tax=Kitasatospora sp. NPDC093550 TaxID=3364089 RepID=UPI0038075F94